MSNWAGKTPTADEWRDILEKHSRWLSGAEGGERADLQGADLHGADLQGADLRGAYLHGADLQGADLQGADLQGADLQGADLQRAYLQGADLQRAYLQGADLQRAYLKGAKNADLAIAQTRILPDGDLIGWKKCRDGVLVNLRIPAEAKRSHAFGRKCRAEYVDVLEVIGAEVGLSLFDGNTTYRAGERVTPNEWNADWTNECSGGIHFFITRAEAEAWE